MSRHPLDHAQYSLQVSGLPANLMVPADITSLVNENLESLIPSMELERRITQSAIMRVSSLPHAHTDPLPAPAPTPEPPQVGGGAAGPATAAATAAETINPGAGVAGLPNGGADTTLGGGDGGAGGGASGNPPVPISALSSPGGSPRPDDSSAAAPTPAPVPTAAPADPSSGAGAVPSRPIVATASAVGTGTSGVGAGTAAPTAAVIEANRAALVPPPSAEIVKLHSMMQATKETEQTCLFYLEMMGWDLPSAMEQYRQSAATGN